MSEEVTVKMISPTEGLRIELSFNNTKTSLDAIMKALNKLPSVTIYKTEYLSKLKIDAT